MDAIIRSWEKNYFKNSLVGQSSANLLADGLKIS